MKLKYLVLDATKAGNQPGEMEDAAFPAAAAALDGVAAFSCAIADGATQGSHSGPWARALCAAFAAAPAAATGALDELVGNARAEFLAWEKDYLAGRATNNRPLQWFEQEVMTSGAYATLVGVHLAERAGAEGTTSAAHFTAVAIGDSCLFHVRGGRIARSFPLTEAAQFSSSPLLIASAAAANTRMSEGINRLAGELAPGEGLLLCTDALAAWVMREAEKGGDPLPRLMALLTAGEREPFSAFLAELRQMKALRNDDVTLAFVGVEA